MEVIYLDVRMAFLISSACSVYRSTMEGGVEPKEVAIF